ncbi:MAG: RNA methyltransferase, partial [Ferruginibacter sp.]|nr:RNA methyltransferase [Ferruginibacter sp.]
TVSWKHFRSSEEAISELRAQGYQIWAAEQTSGSKLLQNFSVEMGKGIAIVFGNEVSGVESSTLTLCDGSLEIPQLGMKHSLNIATAAGVVLWEIIRNRLQS